MRARIAQFAPHSKLERITFLVSFFVAILFSATISVASPPQYALLDLNPPGMAGSFATAVNDNGEVVGAAGPNSRVAYLPAVGIGDQGFVYRNGVTYLLDRLGGSAGSAFGINNAGQIVGAAQSLTGQKQSQAVTYTSYIGVNLGTLGGDMSIGLDINEQGQIVGWAENAQINNRAFLYENGHMVDLGTFGGPSSQAFAINNAGDVVGTADYQLFGNPSQHAFLYTGSRMIDLHTTSIALQGATSSVARDVNASAQVVGLASYFNFVGTRSEIVTFGYVYDKGIVTKLGTLGGDYSAAFAINDNGQIVGLTNIASGSSRPYLYEDGQMYDLNSLIDPMLGWKLLYASDINNNGQIVGYGLIGGERHAFLLSPVPEMDTLPLAILGACAALALCEPRSVRSETRTIEL